MYIPYDGEFIQYLIYSKSLFVDVMFDNCYFYLHIDSLSVLFDQSQHTIEDAIRKHYKKRNKKKPIVDEDIIGANIYHGLSVIRDIGEQFDEEEAYRFLSWAEDRLVKYEKQKNNGCTEYIHNTDMDYYISIEPYLGIWDDEGIGLELMIRYLKLISSCYTRFLNKLLEIEKANNLTVSDVEQLDAIELYYSNCRLKDSVISEMGEDIQQNVYLATLQDIVGRIKEYLTWKANVDPSEKITSLKIKALKWNIEPKQMLYLIDRFDYFSNQLIMDYNQITSFEHNEKPCRFSFAKLNYEASKIADLIQRRSFFVEAKIKATKELIEMVEGDCNREDCQKLIDKCSQSIELTDYEISQKQIVPDSMISKETYVVNQTKATIKPAPKKKTDIIKLLSAMYDARLFVDEDGKPLTNKQKLMDAFGEFLGDDFNSYSTLLSQAKDKNKEVFLKPYRDLLSEGNRYYESE